MLSWLWKVLAGMSLVCGVNSIAAALLSVWGGRSLGWPALIFGVVAIGLGSTTSDVRTAALKERATTVLESRAESAALVIRTEAATHDATCPCAFCRWVSGADW